MISVTVLIYNVHNIFNPRYGSTILAVIVCPSITSRYSTKSGKSRIMQTTSYDSPVFDAKNLGETPKESPPEGAPNRCVVH